LPTCSRTSRCRRAAGGVVSNSAAAAILCADALNAAGLELATLGRAPALRSSGGNPSNPIDVGIGAGAEAYRRVVEQLLGAAGVDALVVLYVPVGMSDTAEVGRAVVAAVEAARAVGRGRDKPVLASILGDEIPTFVLSARGGERVPVYALPEAMARALGKVAAYAEWRGRDPGCSRSTTTSAWSTPAPAAA